MFGRSKTVEPQPLYDQYRRAHLMSLAEFVAIGNQSGPEFHGRGTVSASKEELERVLGPNWKTDAAVRLSNKSAPTAGTMGTAIWPQGAHRG